MGSTDPTPDDDLSAAVMDSSTRHYSFRHETGWRVAIDRTEDERDKTEWEPMIDTLWPLPDNFGMPDDARDRLDNMTIVEVDGYHWLALTGGGMDMSWHIARTYVALGLLPPAVDLGRLPAMGGMQWDDLDRLAVAALRKSHSQMRDRHAGWMRDLDDLRPDQDGDQEADRDA